MPAAAAPVMQSQRATKLASNLTMRPVLEIVGVAPLPVAESAWLTLSKAYRQLTNESSSTGYKRFAKFTICLQRYQPFGSLASSLQRCFHQLRNI
jgi:hypothetical protein